MTTLENTMPAGPGAWFVIRTLLGGGALSIAFGLAIVVACLAIGLVLRGVLEVLAWMLGTPLT